MGCRFRGGSRTAASSKMELFAIIVNGFQPLTIIRKCSILDVGVILDPPLDLGFTSNVYSEICPACKIELFAKIVNG